MGWSVDEKAFYKKWWFIVVVIVLVISVFVGNGGKNEDSINYRTIEDSYDHNNMFEIGYCRGTKW